MTTTTTGKNIYWIGGSKGGVGKSMLTLATLDYLMGRGERLLLIECDTSNPDTAKAYCEELEVVPISLDEADGWIQFVNTCHDNPESTVVVNTAARNNTAVTQYGQTLDTTLEELGRKLVTLWVINRQRDSLELLKEFHDAIPNARIHVVRNAYFGDEKKYELYNTSDLRQTIENNGGKSITLPDLADRVADDIYTRRLSLSAAAKTLPLGNRAELARWRAEVKRVLGEVIE